MHRLGPLLLRIRRWLARIGQLLQLVLDHLRVRGRLRHPGGQLAKTDQRQIGVIAPPRAARR
jgi:hypothetical protein